ncbi:unnamed protein product [Rotaria sp. Silwood1]|nr:unnamed protein product [Rotaria sp. Silwood1]
MVDKVRCLTMDDTHPTNYSNSSHDFSYLKELILYKLLPQQEKQHSSSLIIFPLLVFLNLDLVHVDYVEQFLIDKNTHLFGHLKLTNYGLGRHCRLPEQTLTHEVVTLWYRPSEILLNEPTYGMYLNIWSVSCIFAEMYLHRLLFRGECEIDQ